VENLAHSASFHSLDKIAPSNHGIKQLVRSQLTPAQEASAIFRRKAIYEE
jgi:hypothetical protein